MSRYQFTKRYRFNRKGEVIVDKRQLVPALGTEDWKPQRDAIVKNPGTRAEYTYDIVNPAGIFKPRHSSPARLAYRASRRTLRSAA